MTRVAMISVLLGVVLWIPLSSRGDTSDSVRGTAALTAEEISLFDRAVGDKDLGSIRKLAIILSHDSLVSAFYGTSRKRRLVALQASGYLEDPWPVMHYLVAFLETRQRRVASEAGDALIRALDFAGTQKAKGGLEVPPKQLVQLAAELRRISELESVERDLRILAIQSIEMLSEIAGTPFLPQEVWLEDRDPGVRSAALGMLPLPLHDQFLLQVGKVALDDDDVFVRGQAVGLLCENALQLKVKKPSHDLTELMLSIISEQQAIESMASLLGCLAAMPYETRGELTDRIIAHPDPLVVALWQSLVDDKKE